METTGYAKMAKQIASHQIDLETVIAPRRLSEGAKNKNPFHYFI